MRPQTRLILSDVHIPFQDDTLLKVWLGMLKSSDFDGVDVIGDLIDAYPLSKFDKNPQRRKDLQWEIDQAVDLLKKIRKAAPNADIRYSEGNHENRLKRMLWSSAKDLGTLRNLNIPALMNLKDLDIRYFEPEAPYKIGDLYYLHGDVTRKQNFSKSAGGRAADGVARAIGGSVIMGHTHQMGYAAFRSWERNLEGYEVGCLCRFDLEYVVGVPPWQQGWAVVDFLKSGIYHVDFVRIVESYGRRYIVTSDCWDMSRVSLPSAKKHFILKGD